MDVYFCDEFHLSVGPSITKRIKRKRGNKLKNNLQNVHRKKLTSKEVQAKAQEDGQLKLINVFFVIGYNYRKRIHYSIPTNENGKISSEIYINKIFPQLLPDLQGITLYQDKDSAHDSKAVTAWAKQNGLKLHTTPGKSPDFSIFKSMAQTLKRKFYHRCTTTENAARMRFNKTFDEEMDQKKIQKLYFLVYQKAT